MQTNGQFELYILLEKSYLFRFEQNRGNAVEFFGGQIQFSFLEKPPDKMWGNNLFFAQ